jgi:hypothetical protein
LRNSALLSAGATAAITVPKRVLAAGVPVERANEWLALLQPSTPEALSTYEPVALTNAELSTLVAAIDRLIPPDEGGPGASQAGVHVYIDRTLAGPGASVLQTFQTGLAALEAAAGAQGFAALGPDAQDGLLTQAEAGELPDAPAGFFPLLLDYTRQGMFSDPIYGGNLDYAGWDLVGYSGIKLVWSTEDQATNVEITPEHVGIEQYGGSPS